MKQTTAYRIMWLQVSFDLPVLVKSEQHAATSFRKMLLDNGFEMAQFSIYLRFCSCKEMAEKYIKIIESNLPQTGTINVLMFTDRQYGNMKTFIGKKRKENVQGELFFEEI